MKKLFLMVVGLIILVNIKAQIIPWDIGGKPVRQGVNIEWYRCATVLDDGSVVYVWSDTRHGDRDVWAQRVDTNGNLLWGEEAVRINGEINRQEDIVVINVGNEEVVVAWVDFRNEDAGDIYAQKLDENGNILWQESGVPLCLAEDIQISLNIVSDSNGGAYIIWQDYRGEGGKDLYGSHIMSDGIIQSNWGSNGKPIADAQGDQDLDTFWADGEGGAVVCWFDSRNDANKNLYMQRMNSEGDMLWGDNGVLLSDADGIQTNPKISPDGTGNFIITWRDKRNDNDGDIYAQRIDLDGNLLWDEDLVVYADSSRQRNPRITEASDTGVYIVWEDGRYNPEEFDIFAQKLDINGDKIWNNYGVAVCNATANQKNPRLKADSEDGVWIIWDDGREAGANYEDIYIQHINDEGDIELNPDGQIVCDAARQQFSSLLKINDAGDIFAAWGDKRDGSIGIYIQIYDENANEVLAENGEIVYYGLSGNAENFVLKNKGNKSIVFWQDTRNASIATQIYFQIMNNDGMFDFIEDGIPITEMTGFDQLNLDVAVSGSEDEIAVVWEENRSGSANKQVFAQAVDMQGNQLWGQSGIQLAQFESSQVLPSVSALTIDNEAEYYFAWEDQRSGTKRIYGQKISNNELQWDSEGLQISETAGEDYLQDIVDNYFIWQSYIWPDKDIYVKKVDQDGNAAPGWEENGNPICTAAGLQENSQGFIIPQGLLVIWEDLRNGTDKDIYGQLINADGQTQWEEDGKLLVTAAQDQFNFKFAYSEIENCFVLTWTDFRNGENTDIYMQKYSVNGNPLWQINGLPVALISDTELKSQTVLAKDSMYVVLWEDYRLGDQSEIYGQYISAMGMPQWEENGMLIASGIKNQKQPQMVFDNDGNVISMFKDTRSSGKTDIYNIYAQRLNIGNVAADNDEIDENFIVAGKNFPNPFSNSTQLSFATKTNNLKNAVVEIFNIKGQLVKKIPVKRNIIDWKGRDNYGKKVTTGIYFFRLKSDKYSSNVKKMMYIK